MLDKFLKTISTNSVEESSMIEKIQAYNRQVLEERERKLKETPVVSAMPNKFNNFKNMGQKFQRPNTYQTPPREFKPKEYIDDGSFFCSYASGGNTLVCYKNKEKLEFILEGINHPDKNNYLAKRANYFLNDLVKKKKIFIEQKESGQYEAFFDNLKTESINKVLIEEGYHNSEPYNPESKNKKTSFSKKSSTEVEEGSNTSSKEEKTEIKEKKNYAYGLFATNHNTFEALFNKQKITLKLDNLENISKENQKTCKSMIYDFVSKKSIILKFLKEENGVHFVEVYNKEGECLNSIIASKNFLPVSNVTSDNENKSNNEGAEIAHGIEDASCSEDDWNWTSDNVSSNSNNDKDVPEITNLPSMFKKSLSTNPNSPFAKKKNVDVKIDENQSENTPDLSMVEDSTGEEVFVPEITNLPAMFRKPVSTNPNSPFGKKNVSITDSKINTEEVSAKKKLSFGKR